MWFVIDLLTNSIINKTRLTVWLTSTYVRIVICWIKTFNSFKDDSTANHRRAVMCCQSDTSHTIGENFSSLNTSYESVQCCRCTVQHVSRPRSAIIADCRKRTQAYSDQIWLKYYSPGYSPGAVAPTERYPWAQPLGSADVSPRRIPSEYFLASEVSSWMN